MSILPIRLYPDPVLRVECAPVSTFDDDLEKLVVDMIETLHDASGVGLAAPQIGLETRLAVVDTSDGSRREDAVVLANPEILEADGRDDDIEGCLSIPGIVEKVRRPFEVRVRAQDATGRTYELEAEGLVARAICHEIDHLNGVLFFDHLRGLRRERIRRALRRLLKEQEEAE